jgi:hypothetical protein
MKAIEIKSGFERGGRLLKWDSARFEELVRGPSCTWTGDADASRSIELPDGFQGAVVRWHTDGHTPIPSAEVLGFTAAELAGPAPVEGWGYRRIGHDAAEWLRLADYGQYLRALAEHGPAGVLADSEVLATARHFGGGLAVGELSYEWGCQAASHYAVFAGGVFAREEKGVGDNAPYLTDTGVIRYPSDDRAEFDSACEAVTSRLEREHGQWLRESYARRQNPLPGLRKRIGGVWKFYRAGVYQPAADTPFGELELPGGSRVRWIPAR